MNWSPPYIYMGLFKDEELVRNLLTRKNVDWSVHLQAPVEEQNRLQAYLRQRTERTSTLFKNLSKNPFDGGASDVLN